MPHTGGVDASIPQSDFDSAYAEGSPPWVIGEPQPAVVQLEESGQISGRVLDAGCGTGEHTIYLTERGYDVVGIDFSPKAVERATAKATAAGVAAKFEVADALELTGPPRFDTIIDSALFHVFGAADRTRYAQRLAEVCHPGGRVHVLVLSDAEPGLGPQISDAYIREAFAEANGWQLQDLRTSRYRVIVPPYVDPRLGLTPDQPADMPAWLATARRSD